jgi:hypothetical protein
MQNTILYVKFDFLMGMTSARLHCVTSMKMVPYNFYRTIL